MLSSWPTTNDHLHLHMPWINILSLAARSYFNLYLSPLFHVTWCLCISWLYSKRHTGQSSDTVWWVCCRPPETNIIHAQRSIIPHSLCVISLWHLQFWGSVTIWAQKPKIIWMWQAVLPLYIKWLRNDKTVIFCMACKLNAYAKKIMITPFYISQITFFSGLVV